MGQEAAQSLKEINPYYKNKSDKEIKALFYDIRYIINEQHSMVFLNNVHDFDAFFVEEHLKVKRNYLEKLKRMDEGKMLFYIAMLQMRKQAQILEYDLFDDDNELQREKVEHEAQELMFRLDDCDGIVEEIFST
jgi:hypothetical protein